MAGAVETGLACAGFGDCQQHRRWRRFADGCCCRAVGAAAGVRWRACLGVAIFLGQCLADGFEVVGLLAEQLGLLGNFGWAGAEAHGRQWCRYGLHAEHAGVSGEDVQGLLPVDLQVQHRQWEEGGKECGDGLDLRTQTPVFDQLLCVALQSLGIGGLVVLGCVHFKVEQHQQFYARCQLSLAFQVRRQLRR